MNPKLFRLLCGCAAGLGLLPAVVSGQSFYYIQLNPGDTSGANLVVNAGDYVTWETYTANSQFEVDSDYNFWTGGNVYDFDDGMGNVSTSTLGETFTYGGSYPYTVSGDAYESGTVTVVGNYLAPPTLKVTSPTNNLTFVAPVSVVVGFQATASSPVGFGVVAGYADGVLQGYEQTGIRLLSITNSYYFDFETNQLGIHTLRLAAVDGTGGTSTPVEFPVNIVGTLPPIVIDSAHMVGGKFVFHASNLAAGQSAVVESTASLSAGSVNWVSLSTNPITASSAYFTNSLSGTPHYFRVLQR